MLLFSRPSSRDKGVSVDCTSQGLKVLHYDSHPDMGLPELSADLLDRIYAGDYDVQVNAAWPIRMPLHTNRAALGIS